MVATARTRPDRLPPFRPGDIVKFRFGVSEVIGTIIELVGPIAKGGRMVYRIEFSMGGDTPLVAELTADEFERAK